MRKFKPLLTSAFLVLALVLAGFSSHVVQAETPETIEYEGTITEVTDGGAPFTFVTQEGLEVTVSIVNGIFSLEVFDGDTLLESYEVTAPEGFEFSGLSIDDEFELKATYDENVEEWQFTELKVQNQEQERELLEEHKEEEEQEREEDGFFCSNPEEEHPVAAAIAETYDTDYETVISMFCEGGGEDGSAKTGFGQIMLAFQTAEETDGSAQDILSERLDGKGWGQIWQDLDLIGKPDDAGKPEDVGPPEDAGKPEDVGPPQDVGKPDDAGKPEDVGPPEDAGKPDDVGRPESAGPPDDHAGPNQ